MEPIARLHMQELEKMYRAVIYDAVRDLALTTDGDARDVRRWMRTGDKGFGTVCYLANWDERWVKDMLLAIIRIEGDLRKPVVIECLLLLRGLARVTTEDHDGIVSLHPDAHSAVAEESRLSYASARYRPQSQYPGGGAEGFDDSR